MDHRLEDLLEKMTSDLIENSESFEFHSLGKESTKQKQKLEELGIVLSEITRSHLFHFTQKPSSSPSHPLNSPTDSTSKTPQNSKKKKSDSELLQTLIELVRNRSFSKSSILKKQIF